MKQGWEIKKLEEVCEFFNDGNWIESKDQSETGYRLIQTGNIGVGEFRNKSGKERYVSEETFKRLKCTEILEGDILVSRLPDPVGRTCVIPNTGEKMITAVDCSIVRLKRNVISPDYFRYYSQSTYYFNYVGENITGTTRDRISRKNLGVVPIPIPPLPEQQRIVSILDEAFAAIAKAKANAEQNLRNAKDLFKAHLRSIFNQQINNDEANVLKNKQDKIQEALPKIKERDKVSSVVNPTHSDTKVTKTGGRDATLRHIPGELSLSVGLPEQKAKSGWSWSFLSDLARMESGHTPSRRHPEYWNGDIPWIGIQDARDNHGKLIYNTFQNINELGIENSSARVLPENTVCLSRTASVGYVVVLGRPMATSQDFVNWICKPSLLPDFLKYLLLAEGREGLNKFSSGAVHQTIYFPEAKAFCVCYPEIEVQKQIVRICDDISENCKKLESIYQQKINDLEEMKKSILQKAFNGELKTS